MNRRALLLLAIGASLPIRSLAFRAVDTSGVMAEGTMGKAYGAVVTPPLFIVGAQGTLVYAGGAGDKATMNAKEVRASRSFVREALEDLAAGRKVATPSSRPFGCAIAYRG